MERICLWAVALIHLSGDRFHGRVPPLAGASTDRISLVRLLSSAVAHGALAKAIAPQTINQRSQQRRVIAGPAGKRFGGADDERTAGLYQNRAIATTAIAVQAVAGGNAR
jgi:hypothetical protein